MSEFKELRFALVPEERSKDFQFIKDVIKNYIDCPYAHGADICKASQQIILHGFKRD